MNTSVVISFFMLVINLATSMIASLYHLAAPFVINTFYLFCDLLCRIFCFSHCLTLSVFQYYGTSSLSLSCLPYVYRMELTCISGLAKLLSYGILAFPLAHIKHMKIFMENSAPSNVWTYCARWHRYFASLIETNVLKFHVFFVYRFVL